MKYIMFEHAGSGNHGCEAIVRSTCKMLGGEKYYLQTANWEEDVKYGIDKLVSSIVLKDKVVSRNSFQGLLMRAQSRLNPNMGYDDRECLKRNKKLILRDSIALSIGGDNYCYAGIVHSMRDKIRAYELSGTPTVLWGCSVDRELLNDEVIKDLKRYHLITARESLTMETLHNLGIEESVVSCVDPAFTLEREEIELPHKDAFQSGNVIGINVSDFMKYYNAYPNATLQNFQHLIDYILQNTDCSIALIPHVRQKGNDDLEIMKMLSGICQNERLFCIENDYNCMQLKYVISKCRVFVGCRTHSTIAAYSTCVPTLVVGYSIKARGICKDIFGNYDDLLVDVREFQDDSHLTRIFQGFWQREEELKKHLTEVMPEYIQRAYAGKQAIDKLIER